MKSNRRVLAIIPCALILLFILIFYFKGGFHLFNFDRLHEIHLKWETFVSEKPILSAFYFTGIYILSVILVLPDSTFLCLLGGFLFPMPIAVACACIGETMGATIFFLAIKLAFVEVKDRKRKDFLDPWRKKIQHDQAYYLLFLRLSHLLPFWLINVGAGLFHIRITTFIWTTFIGIFPLVFLLVDGAKSLSKYFETHTHFELKEIFTTQLDIALLGLGCLALLPLLYKKYIK